MHQPSPGTTRQTVTTVITDLEAQRRRLDDAIAWTRSVAKGIMEQGRRVEFTNIGPVEAGVRETGIAFRMAAGGLPQDVQVMTLVCLPSESDLAAMGRETALASEVLRMRSLLHWHRQGVRTFETHLVQVAELWAGSAEETQVLLVREVKAWLGYWFENPPTPVFRPRAAAFHPIERKRAP